MTDRQPAAWATAGLFLAWLVHDLEEAATMSAWSRTTADRLEARGWPRCAEQIRMTPREARVAIALVGVGFAGAAAAGRRSAGASPWFQAALLGFGGHAVTHVAASIATRSYTPGVVTAATVVAPFAIAAVSELRRSGVPLTSQRTGLPTAVFASAVPLAHVAARVALRRLRRSPRPA